MRVNDLLEMVVNGVDLKSLSVEKLKEIHNCMHTVTTYTRFIPGGYPDNVTEVKKNYSAIDILEFNLGVEASLELLSREEGREYLKKKSYTSIGEISYFCERIPDFAETLKMWHAGKEARFDCDRIKLLKEKEADFYLEALKEFEGNVSSMDLDSLSVMNVSSMDLDPFSAIDFSVMKWIMEKLEKFSLIFTDYYSKEYTLNFGSLKKLAQDFPEKFDADFVEKIESWSKDLFERYKRSREDVIKKDEAYRKEKKQNYDDWYEKGKKYAKGSLSDVEGESEKEWKAFLDNGWSSVSEIKRILSILERINSGEDYQVILEELFEEYKFPRLVYDGVSFSLSEPIFDADFFSSDLEKVILFSSVDFYDALKKFYDENKFAFERENHDEDDVFFRSGTLGDKLEKYKKLADKCREKQKDTILPKDAVESAMDAGVGIEGIHEIAEERNKRNER